jgi:outer membrane lipoprotein SlyB
MKTLVVTTMVALAMTGCATNPTYRPIIDTHGVDMNAYERDVQECKQYAAQISPGASAAGGAIAGALLGAALGMAVGGSNNVGLGARVGTVAGAAQGVGAGVSSQYEIVKNCLNGRGYRLLQ